MTDMSIQRPVYEGIRVGSIVELYPEPYAPTTGPDPRDAQMPVPRCRVLWVKRHLNNTAQITAACLVDEDTGETFTLHREGRTIVHPRTRAVIEHRPLGSIHRILHH